VANIEPHDLAIMVVDNLQSDTGCTGTYVKHKLSGPNSHLRDQEFAPTKVLKEGQHLRPGVVGVGNTIEQVLGKGSADWARGLGFS